jgi:hypothetical protein
LNALRARIADVEGLEKIIDTRDIAWNIARAVSAWLKEGKG